MTSDYSAAHRPLSPAERAMRIAWKVQLSEDTRQRKLAMRPDAKDRIAMAEAKRALRKQRNRCDYTWSEMMRKFT